MVFLHVPSTPYKIQNKKAFQQDTKRPRADCVLEVVGSPCTVRFKLEQVLGGGGVVRAGALYKGMALYSWLKTLPSRNFVGGR